MRWLALLLLVGACFAECQPVVLQRGEGLDWNCHLFRRIYRDGHLYIERLRPDRTVIASELVDCAKAVYNPDGGWLEVPLHIIAGSVYCSTPPRRKHEVHGNQPRENERASAANHAAH